jgi:glutamine synthetase
MAPEKATTDDSPFLPRQGLERQLGKSRQEWSADDLVDLFRQRELRILSLMHVGGDGWLKTLDFVPRSVGHLRDVVQGGERADGSQLFARAGILPLASDIVLRPRIQSAFLDPFSELPTLVLLCGHQGRDGRPLPQSPDTILQRAQERLRDETGAELWALGEVEYFLGKRSDEHDIYGAAERGYHAVAPFVFGQKIRRRAMALLADLGVPVKYGHSEAGYIKAVQAEGMIWEQHEIELSLQPLPAAADSVLLTQWVLRSLAHEHGMQCSTDPMMQKGHAGNGLHFHLSPVVDGKHQPVRLPDGALAGHARGLIAGLVRVGAALMAFGNRVDGSFARLVQGKEAPKTIVWGDYDRSALIRLPVVATTEDGRPVSPPTVEFRLPDGSALPHLLLAGAAQAMVEGLEVPDLDDLLERTAAKNAGAGADAGHRVPWNAIEVADELLRQRAVLEAGEVFPEVLVDRAVERLRG